MPKPLPRPPRIGEQLVHTCHMCKEIISVDQLSMWYESDDKVWFVHKACNPTEITA